MKKKIMTMGELAKYIGIDKRSIYRMVAEKRFPVEPLRGTNPRLWSTEQIDQWLRGEKK
jgi:excisionase family DNA binding protein